MITYGSIYLIVKDFDQSVDFYKKLLQADVVNQNKKRFAIFQIDGLHLSIMSGSFDVEHSDQVVREGKYYKEYDDMITIMNASNPGKVVINLCTDDLRKEHQRISDLQIGTNLTEIRYINARMPYYYFSMKDCDGNIIEITGKYE